MFSSQTYIDRRKKLKARFTSGILLFMGNEDSPINYTDNCYPFRQDSSFLYFFGIDQPGLTGIIDVDKDDEIIFGDELSIDDVVWIGLQPRLIDQATAVGISEVKPKASLSGFLSSSRKIHFLPPYRHLNQIKISEWLNIPTNKIKEEASRELIDAVISLRSVKSSEEISQMEEAVNLSRKLHLMAMSMAKKGITELKILSVLTEIVVGLGSRFSYNPIITKNGQTLHNVDYINKLNDGDLLLVDTGAESLSHYAGDITRTFAVGGVFDDRQKEIYGIVLKMEVESISMCKPGISYADVHNQAMITMANGLIELGLMKGDPVEVVNAGAHALFCPHGLGHMIGLDVHDMEDLGEDIVGYDDEVSRSDQFGTKSLRFGRKLGENFTLTVEPGIYFIPELTALWKAEGKFEQFINYNQLAAYQNFGGIRIEDNIVITADGARILGKSIPKNLKDIQS
ncbi:MAG: aminopeptidase P family protein [Bacteroidetes bacterium]|nr:aminopeptidase P family protein [Bacteroidota bacterium]MDA1120466.1 aminopeptidase P family protein [Bacteroidota bacterium]